MTARFVENSLLFDQSLTIYTLRTAPDELGRHIQRVEGSNCILVRHCAQLFAFHPMQIFLRLAPLVHPGALFFGSFGQMHYPSNLMEPQNEGQTATEIAAGTAATTGLRQRPAQRG
jgi:hypothetical protein